MNQVLGARGAAGYVLGRSGGAADTLPDWATAGGAPRPIACYQAKGAASLAASYINLANPGTYDAVPGVAPTWAAATGWTFDGTTQHLTTGITPTNNQASALLIRFSGTASAYGFLAGCGANSTGPLFGIQPNRPNNTLLYANGNYIFPTPSLAAGVVAFAANRGYRNGTQESGTIPVQAGSLSPLYVGGSKYKDTATIYYYASTIQALSIWDTSVAAATWMPAVSAAVALI